MQDEQEQLPDYMPNDREKNSAFLTPWLMFCFLTAWLMTGQTRVTS
jgi:hypothetical protein